MKKITSILLLLSTLVMLFAMSGCSEKDGTPEGMQLVSGGADDAYSFYAPEEWTVANLGDIGCAYVSKVNTTSISFTEAPKPEGTVKEYFESEKSRFPYEITVAVDGESCSFGNGSMNALKYVYTYSYKDAEYSCMQIFVENSERFYIFTYTASNEERDPDNTYYEYYLEKVTASIDAFTFNGNAPAEKPKAEYEKNSDGDLLVTDKALAGFKMYVPDSYEVDFSSTYVSVSRDGVNITMSEVTYQAQNEDEYWDKRYYDLEAIADKITDENGQTVTSFKEIARHGKIEAGDADLADAREYTYALDGTDYHVYQVLLRKGTIGGNVYVYTFTAEQSAYDTYLEEAKSILEKIEY